MKCNSETERNTSDIYTHLGLLLLLAVYKANIQLSQRDYKISILHSHSHMTTKTNIVHYQKNYCFLDPNSIHYNNKTYII